MHPLVCVTWNVNSVRARLATIQKWLNTNPCHVLLLQELKCEKQAFPFAFFENMGFQCAVLGQKTYNGVAILSRCGLEDVNINLPNWGAPQPQARYIDALVGGKVRMVNVYVPNGKNVNDPAYQLKLSFLKVLHKHLQHILTWHEPWLWGAIGI